jgi:DNA replicative helicase MCM subunit Mcm2 (Cdc46/Mcm family)
MNEQEIRDAVTTLFNAVVNKTIEPESALIETRRIKHQDIRLFTKAIKTHPTFDELVKILAPTIMRLKGEKNRNA